jgi:L-fuconolactonase
MSQDQNPTRPIGRRRFLGGSAAWAAVAGSIGNVLGDDRPAADSQTTKGTSMIPIVDTHVHLWDLKTFRLPWLAEEPALNRSYAWADYRQATVGYPLDKAVYMEVDVEPAQQTREARAIVELCRSGKTALKGAVISGRPSSDGFATYLDHFRADPEIKGLRQVLHGPGTPTGYCLDSKFVAGIRLLGDRGLSYDICIRPGELTDAARLAQECPGTSFILDHCGNATVFGGDRSAWKRDIAKVAEQKNVVGKVSGIIASTKGHKWTADDLAPIVNHVLEVFGPDRVVFGGDWPVCTLGAPLGDWVKTLQQIVADRSEADRRKLFHDNAVRVYRLT